MQPLAGIADGGDQSRLNIHMDIFKIHTPIEPAGANLRLDFTHAAFDISQILRSNYRLPGKHSRVRQRALNIHKCQALIKHHRGRKSLNEFCYGLREATRKMTLFRRSNGI